MESSSIDPTKVSVAVVFFNPTHDELNRTCRNIEKLQSLNTFHFHFYLVDNGSSERLLDRNIFNSVQDVVTFIDLTDNRGFGQGNNSVLNQLDSKYHIVMNPDIQLDDLTGFRHAIDYLNHHQDVVLLSPLVRDLKTGQIQYLNRQLPTIFDLLIRFLGPNFFPQRQRQFTKRATGYDHIQLEDNATGSFMILRSAAFKQVGGFDPRFFMYFEDTDLTVRLSKIGRVIFYPDFTVLHGWQRENHSLRGILPMVHSMVKYFNKWGWKWF